MKCSKLFQILLIQEPEILQLLSVLLELDKLLLTQLLATLMDGLSLLLLLSPVLCTPVPPSAQALEE